MPKNALFCRLKTWNGGGGPVAPESMPSEAAYIRR